MTTATGPDTTSYTVVSLEVEGHVATLYLDRPEKRNAMGMAFFAELEEAMSELSSNREVRAIVLAAKGPHFSVGLDLTSLGEAVGADEIGGEGERPSSAEVARTTHRSVIALQRAVSSPAECPKPVIAAVHGYCIGGGVDLVSACDIRLCSADAVFSVRETKMAMVPDIGSLARLPFIVSGGHLAELVYTGGDINADRAERIGLVNRVYPDAEATLAGARELAGEIAANSPLAVEGAKAVLKEARRTAVEASQAYVAAWNAGQLRSHDLSEAVTAFFEHRAPRFEGR